MFSAIADVMEYIFNMASVDAWFVVILILTILFWWASGKFSTFPIFIMAALGVFVFFRVGGQILPGWMQTISILVALLCYLIYKK